MKQSEIGYQYSYSIGRKRTKCGGKKPLMSSSRPMKHPSGKTCLMARNASRDVPTRSSCVNSKPSQVTRIDFTAGPVWQ